LNRTTENDKICRDYSEKEYIFMAGTCESCAFYEYDEEFEYYVCSASMDEDELARFMQDTHYECPYYRLGDEYAVVRKQM